MNDAGAMRTRWIVSRDFDLSLFFGGAALSLLVLVLALVLRAPIVALWWIWLLAFDGSVLLAGFHSPSAGLGFVYEPPIRYLPVPPALGDQPFQPIAYYDFTTDALLFSGAVRIDVLEDVWLSLPAGTYHSFGVGQYVPLPGPAAAGARLTLDGRVVTSTSKSIGILQPTDWFSEGVGTVMYSSGELYQLGSVGGPTPTAKSSWAAIKRLYR